MSDKPKVRIVNWLGYSHPKPSDKIDTFGYHLDFPKWDPTFCLALILHSPSLNLCAIAYSIVYIRRCDSSLRRRSCMR